MALTKVAGDILDPGIVVAGMVTATGFSGPFSGGTDGNFTGDVTVGGNLTVNGDYTTLNTTLREVEILRVDTNSSTTAGIITQTGAGDILNLFDGSTEVFSVADGGNVDVKAGNVTLEEGRLFVKRTTIPSVDVRNSTNTSYSRVILQQGAAEGGYFQISREGTNSTAGAGANSVELNQSSNHPLTIKTNNTERLRIKGTGEVGIGTDNPDQILHIQDSASFASFTNDDDTGESGILFRRHDNNQNRGKVTYSFTDDALLFRASTNGSGEDLRITSGGDLLLQGGKIYGDDAATNTFTLQNTSGNANHARIEIGAIQSSDNGGIHFYTAGASAATRYMTLKGGGNLGIGTDNPDRIIHAFEPTENNLLFLESGDTNTDIIQADTGGSTRIRNSQGSLVFYVNGDASSSSAANAVTGLTIDGDKDVHVYDDLFIPDKIIHEGDTDTSIRFPSADTITAETGGTERLRINSSGKTVFSEEIETPQDYPNYRPTLDFNFVAVKKLDPRVTFTRAGNATYIDEQGGFKWASSNQPRFDHDDTTHESRGLLIEKARANKLSDSNNIDSGSNSGGSPGPTLVSNTVEAPDGSPTATTVNWTTARSSNLNSANTEYTGWDSDPSGKTYSASVWVKGTAGETVNFYFDASGQGSSDTGKGNFTLTGKWQRLSVYHTFPSGSNAAYVRSGARSLHSLAVGTANIVSYWGLTIVEENSPGSSIVTPIMPQTTAADKFSIEGEEFTDFYNQTEGTIFLSASYNDNARSAAIVTIDDTSNESEYTEVGYRSGGASAGNVASYIRTDAGNDQYYKNYASTATLGNEFKVAVAYKDDDYASSVNGQTVDTDTSGTTSKVYDRLRLSAVDTVTYSGSGHYRRLMYYAKRLPNNQVVTLTS